MKLNKYIPFASVYFFINSVGLPLGLTYTALLGPFFYMWVLLKRKKETIIPFISILLPFMIVHIFVIGVDLQSYGVSLLNILLIYCFCQAVYTFLKVDSGLEKIFRRILVINSFLCVIAAIFYFTSYSHFFWIEQAISSGVEPVRRLKLFTYEASYYAVLFTPLFLFYLLQYTFTQNRINSSLLLLMIFLPVVLSFSIGVIGALIIAGLITFIIHFKKLIVKKRVVNMLVSAGVLSVVIFLLLFLFFPGNPFFVRMLNIFAGEDGSGQGRTSDAFNLATKLLKEKNEYWGIGPGQIKTIGQDIIRSYYQLDPGTPVAIPNAMAETLAMFGWIGFVLRIAIELLLFLYTKVWTNYYRLLLFLFAFIYQFTGSFITNAAEYVIWILAFTNVFRQFDVNYSDKKL